MRVEPNAAVGEIDLEDQVMKYANALGQKSRSQRSTRNTRSACAEALSMRPPRYGVDFADGVHDRNVHESARLGLSGSAEPLPYLDTIQKFLGPHDFTRVNAFIGGSARAANERMGSTAYATKESVAFKESPDLRTVAHEAAHIIQQRAGVPLEGGVGSAGDRYERNADAVADLVVHSRSASALLDQYVGLHSMEANSVQCNGVCEDLRSGLSNSMRLIELYREFLEGNIDWEEVASHTEEIGNFAQGVVGAGRELPQILQDAINEVEEFSGEEVIHFLRLASGLPSVVFGSGEFLRSQYVTNEIERQDHYNTVLIRYMYENDCPDVPGQWTDYQQQILPIGTRRIEERPARRREHRTALAWVAVNDEHVLMLATEVEGSGLLRFERWIGSEMRDLALVRAVAIQGSVPTVPGSMVVGLPFEVPNSAARR